MTGGSLFAEESVVVITAISDLDPGLFDAVLAFAQSPSEELALVLVHPGGVKGKGLLDKLKKAKVVTVDCPSIKAWELPGFAVNEARLLGGRLDKAVADRLVEALGADVRAVAGAIRQLLADADDRVITEAAVRRYFAGRADVTSFTVADHVMAGRRDEALGALRWALETGVATVLVTSALANALRSQGKYTDLASARLRDGDLARELGVPPFKVKEIVARSRDWTPRGLASALQARRRGGRRRQGPVGRRGLRAGKPGHRRDGPARAAAGLRHGAMRPILAARGGLVSCSIAPSVGAHLIHQPELKACPWRTSSPRRSGSSRTRRRACATRP